MNKQTFTVEESSDGIRLDRFLVECSPDWSRAILQRLIKDDHVLLNGEPAKRASIPLKTGDTVSFSEPVVQDRPAAEEGLLDILYEDDDLLVINKPAGLTIHPTDRRNTGTLVNQLLAARPDIAKAIYDEDSAISHMRPGIVHRLDHETSGVLVVAKTKEALTSLAQQFQDHTVEKVYTALVFGNLDEDVTISKPIRRKPGNKLMMGISLRDGVGRPAKTHIKPVEHFTFASERLTLIQCTIETGRTHQIRVHSKFLGHPVIGDHTYTNKPAERLNTALECPRQFLHASSLSFTQPTTGVRMTITAPLASDLEAVLTKLKRT